MREKEKCRREVGGPYQDPNRVRGKDATAPPSGAIGMYFSDVINLTVENNVVDQFATNNFIRQERCTTVQAFNNRQANTEFVQAYNIGTGLHVYEITNQAEAILLTL